nr:hypothetical protein [uncultured Desulfobacter sp.]
MPDGMKTEGFNASLFTVFTHKMLTVFKRSSVIFYAKMFLLQADKHIFRFYRASPAPPKKAVLQLLCHRKPFKFIGPVFSFTGPQPNALLFKINIIPFYPESFTSPTCQMNKSQKYYPVLPLGHFENLPKIFLRWDIPWIPYFWHFRSFKWVWLRQVGVHI